MKGSGSRAHYNARHCRRSWYGVPWARQAGQGGTIVYAGTGRVWESTGAESCLGTGYDRRARQNILQRRPAGRGGTDVPACTDWVGDSPWAWPSLDTQYGQKPLQTVSSTRQARSGRADVWAIVGWKSARSRRQSPFDAETAIDLGMLQRERCKLDEAEQGLCPGTGRLRENSWNRTHDDARYSQQPWCTISWSGQAGQGGADVPTSTGRVWESPRTRTSDNA